jgi:O-antigen/teichoic acid export membrane protein
MVKEVILKKSLADIDESHKFAGDIIWISVATLITSAILGIVTLPALTKSYTSEMYGIWIQMNVTVLLVSPIFSLQFGLVAVRFLAGEVDTARVRQSLGAMLTAIVIFSGAASIAGFFLSRPLSVFLFDSPVYTRYVLWLIIWTYFNVLFNFLASYWRAQGKMKKLSVISVSLTVMKMIAIVGLASTGASLESIIISMVALQFAFSAIIGGMIVREIGFPRPNFQGLKTFLTFSIPQMPGGILLWVIGFSDRYFITHFLGLSMNGIYSAANNIAGLTQLFYTPISYVLLPLITLLWEQRRVEDVRRYTEYSFRFFLTFAIPGVIGITFLSQPLLKLLATNEYMVGEELVLLVSLGTIFLGMYQIFINIILLDKYARLTPLMISAACVTSVVMNVALIPHLGILGAALANCAAYLVLAVMITHWARKTINFHFDFRYLGKVIASAGILFLSLYFLKIDSLGSLLLAILLGTAVYLIGLFLFRAFSDQDKQFMWKMLSNIVPGRPGKNKH